MRAQVEPLEDAPDTLKLSSGTEIAVQEIFKTTFIETTEPVLALRYLTTADKDDACSEAEQVWAAFRPIVEKEKLKAAAIYATDGKSGWTWIWKQAVNGQWDTPNQTLTADGLSSTSLIADTKRAHAIVRLRLFFGPGEVVDPQYPALRHRMIARVVVIETLKKASDFLGEAAWREACSAFHAGERWSGGAEEVSVDYLVFCYLPVGDFVGYQSCRMESFIPVTDGVLRRVERTLQSEKISANRQD